MALLRFMSPRDPDLELTAVPANFVNGVLDIDDSDTGRISRLRYLGVPYGVVQMSGPLAATGSVLTASDIAAAVGDQTSLIGAAVFAAAVSSVGAVVVWSGANASTARPTVSAQVLWFGTVEPDNMDGTFNDVFIPVSAA